MISPGPRAIAPALEREEISVSLAFKIPGCIPRHVLNLESTPRPAVQATHHDHHDLFRILYDVLTALYRCTIGEFGPRQMQKPFEDASFSTPIGTMSDIISTDSGVHLILRTG